MMAAGALVVSLLAGLTTFGVMELLVDDEWTLDFGDGDDEVCVAPTGGSWQALALSISDDIKMKSKIRRRNLYLETTRREMEEAGMDTFDISMPSAVSLEKNFFQFLEEAVPEMKKHASTKQYHQYVVKFMQFIRKRIHRDIILLNKTIHIQLMGPDGLPTGLTPVVEYLDEHMKNREDDMAMLF